MRKRYCFEKNGGFGFIIQPDQYSKLTVDRLEMSNVHQLQKDGVNGIDANVVSQIVARRHDLNLIRGRYRFKDVKRYLVGDIEFLIDRCAKLVSKVSEEQKGDLRVIIRKMEDWLLVLVVNKDPTRLLPKKWWVRNANDVISILGDMFPDPDRFVGDIYRRRLDLKRHWKGLVKAIREVDEGNGLGTMKNVLKALGGGDVTPIPWSIDEGVITID